MSATNTSIPNDASSLSAFPNHYGIQHPTNVDLTTVDLRDVVCFLTQAGNEYNGQLGARVSAIFVVFFVSTAATFFPVLATRSTRVRIPLYVYLFARYFGAGVIVATAFIHLLDPAYAEIGPDTCVGMTAGWREYSWPPALALTSAMFVFLMEFGAERWVEKRYLPHGETEDSQAAHRKASVDASAERYSNNPMRRKNHQNLHSSDQDDQTQPGGTLEMAESKDDVESNTHGSDDEISLEKDRLNHIAFREQIAAFLILEFGVLFHSIIIGLALGTAGAEFGALYPVIVFHQSFEGLGIGARLSAIPFPEKLKKMPWFLCLAYGLTTPLAIAASLGVRTTYSAGSFTASIVSGILDSVSAGILMYTGFVELIARDFLFNPERSKDDKQLAFMVLSLLLGAGLMALLGKWA